MKKAVTVVLSVLCAILFAIGLAACNKNNNTYEITVKSVGGAPLYDVEVSLYDGNNEVATARTDKKGSAKLNAKAKTYTIVLNDLPAGYNNPAKPYMTSADSKTVDVYLQSSVIESEMPRGKIYNVGDVMYDFSVTTDSGETFQLSKVLKTRTFVLINLWATWCGYCIGEFPHLAESYAKFDDENLAAVIALSRDDSINEIQAFKAQSDYSYINFPMAYDSPDLRTAFSASSIPVSIYVDRYGVCADIQRGALPSADAFDAIFEKYTDENYSQNFQPGTPDEVKDFVKPSGVEMPPSSVLEEAANAPGFPGTYRAVTENDSEQYEYYWPWLAGKDDRGSYIYSSNLGIDDPTYSGLFLDIEMKKDQMIVFDLDATIGATTAQLAVVQDGLSALELLGPINYEGKSQYIYVAREDGTQTLLFSYISTSINKDVIKLRNFRLLDKNSLPAEESVDNRYHVATSPVYDGNGTQTGWNTYQKVGLNPLDGYYHLLDDEGKPNGAYVLLDTANSTHFSNVPLNRYLAEGQGSHGLNEEDTLLLQQFASYASVSDIPNYTPVTQKLKDVLVKFCHNLSGDTSNTNENEWLELCSYYVHYGKGEDVFGSVDPVKNDPIKGCAPFSSVKLKETTGIPEANYKDEYNAITISRLYYPRGIYAEFVPAETGLYRFRSYGVDKEGNNFDTMCYITDLNEEEISLKSDEMTQSIGDHFTIYVRLEKGKRYFARCDFYLMGQFDTFYVGIERITADSEGVEDGYMKVERRLSASAYTFDEDIYNQTNGQIFFNTPTYLADNYGQDADGNWVANINVEERKESKIYLDLHTAYFFPAIEKVFYPDKNSTGEPVELRYFTRDRHGEPIYARDENGNIIYDKDENGNSVPRYEQTFKLDFDFSPRNDGIDNSKELVRLRELTGNTNANYNGYMLELVDNARKTGNYLVEVTEELEYILNMFVHRITPYRTPDLKVIENGIEYEWAKGEFIDSMATATNPAREWIHFCVYYDYYEV